MSTADKEQLRNEFSPTGSGTGHTLRTLEQAYDNYISDIRSPLQSTQRNYVFPELNPEVVSSIEKSLKEWRTVCQLLRIDQPEKITGQQTTTQMSQMSNSESDLEASIRKLAFWLDNVSLYLNSSGACLGGDFNQNAVIAHIKVNDLSNFLF
ncbi:unnamed protein product [Rodentolepis nana]|uniref:Dynein heavy chain tail domain-containing protein n=1 Tax=Rodentolepis nana TaxID=102285 RepID=A0A0R3TEK0_RODNA|nr:unnamed protein product [Rodentolepis nana]